MELIVLNRKKAALKAQITRIETFIEENEKVKPVNKTALELKLKSVEKIQLDSDDLRTKFYGTIPENDDVTEVDESFATIETRIEDIQVRINSLLRNESFEQKTVPSDLTNVSNVRLPEIPLPKFYGKYDEWSNFKAQFNNVITNNSILTDNQKLHYLKAALQGDAKHLEAVDDSFESLFQALITRYEKKRIIVDTHVNSLLEIEKLSQESSKDIRNIVDNLNKNIRALKILEFERNNLSDILLLNITLKKVDKETRRQFELTVDANEVPSLDNFIAFLEKRSQTLESINRVIPIPITHKQKQAPYKSKSFLNSYSNNSSNNCIICKSPHMIYKCGVFQNMKVADRFNLIKRHNLCPNCLLHSKKMSCKSKRLCQVCQSPHHTLLHVYETSVSFPPEIPNTLAPVESKEINDSLQIEGQSCAFSNCLVSERQNTILPTAFVYIKSANQDYLRARALLDSGSVKSFCTNEIANKLKLKKERINAPISGLNELKIKVYQKINSVIANRSGSFMKSLDFLILPKITNLTPLNPVDITGIDIPSHIDLADTEFGSPGKIDILIGCELFFELLKPNRFRTRCGNFLFQETVFGYIAVGGDGTLGGNVYCGLAAYSDSIDQQLRNFWEIETVEEPSRDSNQEEELCETQFQNTHYRNEDGRYVVQLPLKGNPNTLGDSESLAKTRLNQLWKQLSKNEEMQTLYRDFLKEYADLQHMEIVVDNPELHSKCYYFPHHGVLRPDSNTTKLRVVFNGSAKTTSGISLNDILCKGGILQQDLFSILLRFRQHKYVFTADIQKMFRQILIHPDQQNLQLILWKDSPTDTIKTYKLKTVTYGTKCAPYLATRTLQQLASDERENYPLAASIATRDIYMDDILSGSSDLAEAKILQSQLINMFQQCGMSLHKWCANTSELLQGIPQTDQAGNFLCQSSDHSVKTLGIMWNPKLDFFGYKVSVNLKDCYTKRSILSIIARLFDPLGLLGPIITRAKVFLQKLWVLQLGWDEPLPPPTAKEWHAFVSTLPCIADIQIPRFVLERGRIILHGFADACATAYGAAIYIQSFNNGQVCAKLLCSKSRVSPIKPITIPRLELCGCVLLSQLLDKVRRSLNLPIESVMLYTDSTIVLAWIQRLPNQLKTFISNRVQTIQQLTKDCQWNHVPSEENPADLLSRGLNASDFSSKSLWWYGPTFLQKESVVKKADFQHPITDTEYLKELKQNSASLIINSETSILNDILNFSNDYTNILHVLSYIFRFLHNCKEPSQKRIGKLDIGEIKEAENCVLKNMQQAAFKEEIRCLKRGEQLSGKSKLLSLNPFMDGHDILRVGGRLTNSNLSYFQKHPAIIPSDHPMTKIIIAYIHIKNLHVGPQALLYCVRQKFWPIRGRSVARKVVHDCIICFKNKPIVTNQLMGSLPQERVNLSFPFHNTGVDFCGPFYIKYKYQRKGIFHKVYVAIFVCFATKAVHFEMVSDLTTESFIATLKRFVARRGMCATLWSDNAKCFVGSNLELKRLHNFLKSPDGKLASYLTSEGIVWNFIPPRAPNFGGLWEAGVKSFKFHLKRTVGNLKLTYEEFLTVTSQIEGILNSRPLTPLSADIDDLEALTPGHFLVGRPLNAIAEPSLLDKPEHTLSRWQKMTKLVQQIWIKWSRDYLNTLQQRNKWRFEKQNVKLDSLVIIKEDNLPVCNWILGRIVKLFPGPDGKIRVVEVKTSKGTFKRGIGRVCILPLEEQT